MPERPEEKIALDTMPDADEAERLEDQEADHDEAEGGIVHGKDFTGVTLGAWFHGGRAPIEVTTVVDEPPGLEVDEHSITVARYVVGLSKYETRWGTFSDPWTHQPQPKCGFVVVGREGTISSYDYEPTIRVQTKAQPEAHDLPVDTLQAPRRNRQRADREEGHRQRHDRPVAPQLAPPAAAHRPAPFTNAAPGAASARRS